MPRFKVIIREVRVVERVAYIEADNARYARLAAEDPENWQDPSDLREDVETSELTGVDVFEVRSVDTESGEGEG